MLLNKRFWAWIFFVCLSCQPIPSKRQNKDHLAPEGASGFTPKQAVSAKRHMVASANALASQAGLKILNSGGNALDAAIAVQMALNVVEPQSSGIGGGGFLLYYDAAAKTLSAYDGRESAPKNAHPKMFLKADGTPEDFYEALVGGKSVGVPGIIKMLKMAHDKHGKRAWSALFTEAVALAQNGFLISARLHGAIKTTPNLNTFAVTRAYFFESDGKTPKAQGVLLKNPELANTLRTIAKDGGASFYSGEIAKDIVKTVTSASRNPGRLALSDLQNYRALKRDAICLTYRVYDVCGFAPPTSGGIATLQILGMLENFGLGTYDADSAELWHLFLEASRLAFADRDVYVADSDFIAVPTKELLDESYLKSRAALIRKDRALGTASPGVIHKKAALAKSAATEFPSTSHLVVVDGAGNVASFTTSIENGFGSTLMVRGFLLNNTMTDFSFAPEVGGVPVANAIAPGKRPRSSMAPTIVFRSGTKDFVLAVGSPGGARIIDYVAKTLVGVLDLKLDVQAAIALPNLANRNGVTELEKGSPAENLAAKLKSLGHEIQIVDLNSGLHGIARDDGKLVGGADPRREGVVLGR